MQNYATECLYESCGNLPISKDIEEKINNIAKEIDLHESIVIRKMNVQAMKAFGYHNAFACYPQLLLGCITFNKPHVFISEGFIEDLSPEEQRFIIGHELVHIKKHHILYLVLIMALIELAFLGFWWLIMVKHIKQLALGFNVKYQKKILYTFLSISLFFCLFVPRLIELAYKRHIEREADTQTLQKLKCHEGALKIIDRWLKEFKIPLNNNYYGILSDHPSALERKNYCLKYKQIIKD